MKTRTTNIKSKDYPDYGGRGIHVAQRWINDFDTFLLDMGESPPRTSIERIDNNGNYEPNNCYWAPVEFQARNKRSVVPLTAFGRTQLISDWAREYEISRSAISWRIKRGMSVEQAITNPRYARLATI